MKNKTCGQCCFFDVDTDMCFYDADHLSEAYSDSEACAEFESVKPFHQITESPEVLANKLVYRYDGNGTWRSYLLYGCNFWTKAEAITATVAKLKEMTNE